MQVNVKSPTNDESKRMSVCICVCVHMWGFLSLYNTLQLISISSCLFSLYDSAVLML